MITIGTISEIIENNPYKVRVNLPIFDKIKDATGSTPTEDLQEAIFCTLGDSTIIPQIGDAVVVSFLNNDPSIPIIIGWLYRDPNTSNYPQSQTLIDLNVNSINTTGTSTLGKDTSIGEVAADSIQQLKDCDFNIKAEHTKLTELVTKLEKRVAKLEELLYNQILLNSDIAVMSMIQQRELQEICKTFDKLHHTDFSKLVGNTYPTQFMTRFTKEFPNNYSNGDSKANVGELSYDIKWSAQSNYIYLRAKITNIDGSQWGDKSWGSEYRKEK